MVTAIWRSPWLLWVLWRSASMRSNRGPRPIGHDDQGGACPLSGCADVRTASQSDLPPGRHDVRVVPIGDIGPTIRSPRRQRNELFMDRHAPICTAAGAASRATL